MNPGQLGNDLPITEQGRAACRLVGSVLGSTLESLWTSPVRRCQETADCIREGSGSALMVAHDRMLGDPGVFVTDAELAWSNWKTLGDEGVMNHLVSGSGTLPGMADPMDAAHRLLWRLADQLGGPVGVHLFVTHDVVMVPFVSRLLGLRLVREDWPGFLECVTLWREERGLLICYREHQTCLL